MNFSSTINRLFNDENLRARVLSWRWPLSLGFFLFLLIQIKPIFFWPGLLLSALGEALQVWCFASLHKKKELAARGPYALVRNPMYIGRFLLLLGAVAMTGNIFWIIIFSVVYYFYMVNRVSREEAVLREIFGSDYLDYCRRTGRFLPQPPFPKLEEYLYFRWDLFFKNNAHLNLAAMLLAYLLIYLFVI